MMQGLFAPSVRPVARGFGSRRLSISRAASSEAPAGDKTTKVGYHVHDSL